MSGTTLVLTLQLRFYQNGIEHKRRGVCSTYLGDKSIQRKCTIAAEHLDEHTVSSNNSYNLQIKSQMELIKTHTCAHKKISDPITSLGMRYGMLSMMHELKPYVVCRQTNS